MFNKIYLDLKCSKYSGGNAIDAQNHCSMRVEDPITIATWTMKQLTRLTAVGCSTAGRCRK